MTELVCTCILNTKYAYLDEFSFYTRTPWIQEVKKVLINVGLVLHICHWNEWIRVTIRCSGLQINIQCWKRSYPSSNSGSNHNSSCHFAFKFKYQVSLCLYEIPCIFGYVVGCIQNTLNMNEFMCSNMSIE